MKISKKNAGYIFIIVILVGMLGLSIYLGLSGWYLVTEPNYATDLQLGKTVQVGVRSNEASAISLNIEGSYLPGQQLPQVIAVKNIDSEKGVFVRAKAYIESGNNISTAIELDNTANWIYREEDGYYYYNDFLSAQNKSTLSSAVYVPSDMLLQTTKKYIITCVFESLDQQQDVYALWKFNPIANLQ